MSSLLAYQQRPRTYKPKCGGMGVGVAACGMGGGLRELSNEYITLRDFPVPSRDVTNQTLPGGE
jgi:hypothetical protein